MSLPLRTLAPCPFCGMVVIWGVWDGILRRYQWLAPHRSPVRGDIHHCVAIARSKPFVARGRSHGHKSDERAAPR